jgi:16S rRNA (cytidine1402-2'-O)-methyltransferase
MDKYGTLFLIPSVIAEDTANSVIPQDIIKLIYGLNEFIVENERTARRFLKTINYSKSLDSLILHTLNKHTAFSEIPSYINSLLNGKDIGLLSEAGCPCIADPGSEVVRIAHLQGILIKPLVGPSSILLALIASGFNGQNFAFNGYLPIEKSSRIKKIKELENKAIHEDQTQMFMETPFRNMSLLNDILNFCKPSTLLCIAADITGANEYIQTKSVTDWKKSIPQLNKITAIFLLYK